MVQTNQLDPLAALATDSDDQIFPSVSIQGDVRAIHAAKATNQIEIEVEHSSLVITMEGSRKTFNLRGVRRIRAIGDLAASE